MIARLWRFASVINAGSRAIEPFAFIISQITGNTEALGQNGFGSASPGGYGLKSVFIGEVVLTAFFVLVILGATAKEASPGFAGIAIGMALVVIHIVGIPISGTSVNPARSFGPALLAGGVALHQLWLFISAPLIGSVLGAVGYNLVFDCSDGKTSRKKK